MVCSESEYLKNRLYKIRLTGKAGKKGTVSHFLQEEVSYWTIYYIIKKYEESGNIADKPYKIL